MATKEKVIALIDAAPMPKGRKTKVHGDRMTITEGSFAHSDHGPCVTEAIVGTGTMIKRADNWIGYYYGGVLVAEDRM